MTGASLPHRVQGASLTALNLPWWMHLHQKKMDNYYKSGFFLSSASYFPPKLAEMVKC